MTEAAECECKYLEVRYRHLKATVRVNSTQWTFKIIDLFELALILLSELLL